VIVIMRGRASQAEIDRVLRRIEAAGCEPHPSSGQERTIVGVVGDVRAIPPESLEVMAGVERVVRVIHPFKLASSLHSPRRTVVRAGGVPFGGPDLVVIAGPCAVEDGATLGETAAAVARAGAAVLRGGAFKPRTSPYSFQGLGVDGLPLLAAAGRGHGLAVVTEVTTPEHVGLVAEYADILQVGARNMQNFALLQEVGDSERPVLLKRGMSATIEEWLMSAEYILSRGNGRVILCERGIRTYEPATRNTLDLSAVPVVRSLSHLPVIVDPSHATGKADLVPAMARAAIAAGADGLMVEVHPSPADALSDGQQSLDLTVFQGLMDELQGIARAMGRGIRRAAPVGDVAAAGGGGGG